MNEHNRKTHRPREQTDGCQRGEGLGGSVEKKGVRSINWQSQNSHEDVKSV